MRAVWSFEITWARRGGGEEGRMGWDGMGWHHDWRLVCVSWRLSEWLTEQCNARKQAASAHDTATAATANVWPSLYSVRVAYGQGFLGVGSELSSPFRDCIDIDEETADFLQWLVMPLVVLYFMRMMSVLDRHCECASCLSLAQKTESQITTDFSGGLMTNLHFTSLRMLIWRFPNMSYY